MTRWAVVLFVSLATGCAPVVTSRGTNARLDRKPRASDVDRVLYEVITRASRLEAPCPDKDGRFDVCLVVLDQPSGEAVARPTRISFGLQALLGPVPVRYFIGERCRSELATRLTVGPLVWHTADHVTVHADMNLSGIQGTYADFELKRLPDGRSWSVSRGPVGFFN